jgi:predicted nucleic acid-binding protein
LKLLLNQQILLEYEEILKRYSGELNLTLGNIDVVLDGLCNLAELHSSGTYWVPKLQDPDDETFAKLAFEASAHFLVTHNLRHFRPVSELGLNVLAPKQILGII